MQLGAVFPCDPWKNRPAWRQFLPFHKFPLSQQNSNIFFKGPFCLGLCDWCHFLLRFWTAVPTAKPCSFSADSTPSAVRMHTFPSSPSRFCAVSLSWNPDHAQTKHVLHGPPAGEGGFWDVLLGCSALPQLLLALSHRLLSFRESLSDFFQTGLFRDCSTDYGELCPLALLLILLLPTATAHLPLHHLCPGHFRHYCGTVGPVCHS